MSGRVDSVPPLTTNAHWRGRDWVVALALVLATAASRWPFRTTMLWAWDSGLFARALQDYNVIPHFPQPPGYIFYVGVVKLVAWLTGGTANQALVLVSIGGASLTVATIYLLTVLLFDRLTALLAAGLALTSVSFWFFSEIAYPYTVLACGSTVVALFAWHLAHGRWRWPPLAALCFGLLAGFRQDLLLFITPLFAGCYWLAIGASLRHGWRQLLLGLLAGAGGIATWWFATDLASEGWGSLWRALTVQSANVERGTSAFAVGLSGLRENGQLLLWFTKDALHLAALPLLAYGCFALLQPRVERWRPIFLLLWLAPAVLFYLLVHIGEAGYIFSFLPACLIGAAAGLTRAASALVDNLPAAWVQGWGRRLQQAVVITLALLILPYHVWLFVGSGRLVSADRLACKDQALQTAVSTISSQYPPATTEIVTSTYLQHLAIYLPQYRHVRFLAPERDLTWTAPAGIERVVVFDLELVQRMPLRSQWQVQPLACAGRYDLVSLPAAGARFSFLATPFTLEVTR